MLPDLLFWGLFFLASTGFHTAVSDYVTWLTFWLESVCCKSAKPALTVLLPKSRPHIFRLQI